MKIKKVAIVGAGLMTQPMVDYFIDNRGYQVIVLNRTLAKAEKVLAGRVEGRAVALLLAISAKLIVEGKIKATGVLMPPTLPELYKPVLNELKIFDFEFTRKTMKI